MPCRIVNSQGYYLLAIHGTNHLSWVEEKDKAYAMVFASFELASAWLPVLYSLTDLTVSVTPCV